MNFLSLCSGIDAASVAWLPLGWKCLGFSEIEPFPCAVLKHHYPDVPNFGDMTRYKEWPDLGTVDVIIGGTPCQSFSVAGLRKGLDDPRGNLALVYLGVVDRFRPDSFVWENVPGVLSSGGGRDFGSFLGGVAELGYGFAYRVLDAQFYGVAQRRRRVFVVGCLGSWQRPAAVLFERESLRWDSAPRREAGQDVTDAVARSIRGRSNVSHREDSDNYVVATNAEGADGFTLTRANLGKHLNNQTPLIAHSLRAEGHDASKDGTGRGKLAADGPKYKALGNSMAVPVIRWLGERIETVKGIETP